MFETQIFLHSNWSWYDTII